MKKLFIIVALALLPLLAGAQNEPVRRNTQGRNNRSNTNSSRANRNNSRTSVSLCPDSHHPHAIDLGLPSGTKWACCNVGARTPIGYGSFYAWSETSSKSTYNDSTYLWRDKITGKRTKYCTESSLGIVDNKTQLELDDDAAYANWRGSWRMPSAVEAQELIDNTSNIWITLSGVNGRLITSKTNGHSIFLPAAGWFIGSKLENREQYGCYWSSTLYGPFPYYAISFGFAKLSGLHSDYCYYYYGQSVRPVLGN